MNDNPFIPATATEALARWDRGEPVFTVEMGGMGPGYEQCIHILAFELIRALIAAQWVTPRPYPAKGTPEAKRVREAWDAIVEPVIRELNKVNGFSGAQVGAAQNLAAKVWNDGWRAAVDAVEQDRHIMVSRAFPVAPDAPKETDS